MMTSLTYFGYTIEIEPVVADYQRLGLREGLQVTVRGHVKPYKRVHFEGTEEELLDQYVEAISAKLESL